MFFGGLMYFPAMHLTHSKHSELSIARRYLPLLVGLQTFVLYDLSIALFVQVLLLSCSESTEKFIESQL